MRRVLAWLDRRIDGRIALFHRRGVADDVRTLPTEAAADIRAVSAIHDSATKPRRGGGWMGAYAMP